MELSDFGRDFLLLALRIGKHKENYVDYYIGPKNLQRKVETEVVKSPNNLLNDCKILQKNLFMQRFDKARERYLEKMLLSMKTSIEILNGTNLPFKEQIYRLYDIVLEPVNESELDELKEDIIDAYSGSKGFEEKMVKLRKQRTIPKHKVFEFFKTAINIVRNRTQELFINLLPKEEKVIIKLIEEDKEDKAKWNYYERYQGKFRSLIEVNPNYNMYWTTLLSSAAHEGYPGHHMEFTIKEQKLCFNLNQFEHLVLLLNSPKLIISEGIADIAINMLYTYREHAKIAIENFCLNPSKMDTIDLLTQQYEIRDKIHLFSYNLAYLSLVEKWSEKKLLNYATSFEIYSKETIKNLLLLTNDQVYASTLFSYTLGRNLLVNRYGGFPSLKNFQQLLTNSTLPSDLV
ncbi:MAG: hypothetical protein ACFE8N_01365 [Promethearchaeota archaeon]